MERIPSTVILHKRLDSSDNRFRLSNVELENNPLENNLGVFDFGKYHQAALGEDHAFEPVRNLIDIELESDSGSESSEDETDEPQQPRAKRVRFSTEEKGDSTTGRERVDPAVALFDSLAASKDKLFFISRSYAEFDSPSWELVQVDTEDTTRESVSATGLFHVRFWIRCVTDAKKMTVRKCRYWPCIHEFKRDRRSLGPLFPTKPTKVGRLLETKGDRYFWYQDSLDLVSCKLSGPFDFDSKTDHEIPDSAWEEMKRNATTKNVYTGDLDRIVPLEKPDPSRQKTDGDTFTFAIQNRQPTYCLDPSFSI